MKLIGALSGATVLRVSPEDVAPRNGVPWSQLIPALTERYKFAATTPVAAAPPLQPQQWIQFQNGEFELSGKKVAILQLFLTSGGAVVGSTSTEVSDRVVDDLIGLLDHSFEFRIAASSHRRTHVSEIVVQFEPGIEVMIDALARLEAVVNRFMTRDGGLTPTFKLKRITLGREGFDTADLSLSITPLDGVEATEFVIERRQKHPYSENRYFSRAPLSTAEHISALEMIEQALPLR